MLIAAVGIFLMVFSQALPDSVPGSPRLLVGEFAVALLTAAIYEGAPPPQQQNPSQEKKGSPDVQVSSS